MQIISNFAAILFRCIYVMLQLGTQEIIRKLKAENCFWSYSEDSIMNIPNDIIIEKTLVYLDLPEIDALFRIFPFKQIKRVWLEQMVPQGEYLFTLNRFLAWYYFRIKRPDQYLKAMTTRHYNKIFS